ncbi:MAG TPA: hypothetical protein VMK12_25480 [Anaeromyxobacteraceae bacterium]|nr:hypothetical protein [Anaeromyxobacteraceae bacterium]
MSSHLRRCARIAVAVVTLLGAPAARGAQADPLATAADALSTEPRDGTPTYEQTVEWLSSHLRAHSRVDFNMGGVDVITSFEIQPTRFGCVLGLLRTGRNVITGLSVGGAFLLALHEVNRESIAVLRVTGSACCIDLKGSERMVLEIKNSGSARRPRPTPGAPGSTFRVCFDTAESAERAAKALRHAAELCGEKGPI